MHRTVSVCALFESVRVIAFVDHMTLMSQLKFRTEGMLMGEQARHIFNYRQDFLALASLIMVA